MRLRQISRAGTYSAVLTVNADPQSSSATIPITFVVTAPAPVLPTVTSIVNGATFAAGPAVPGSIFTLMGTTLSGKNIRSDFRGLPAQILFDNATQINVVVPAGLGSKSSAQLVVVVDGVSSVTKPAVLAGFSPGIFANGILNQHGRERRRPSGHFGQYSAILPATGLSGSGKITARVNGKVVQPIYGGVAPGIPGVQQVNVQLPEGLTGPTAEVSVCGGVAGMASQAICSPTVQVAIAQ